MVVVREPGGVRGGGTLVRCFWEEGLGGVSYLEPVSEDSKEWL